MGKNARERKLQELERERQLKEQIRLRREERLVETKRIIRKTVLTLAGTVLLFYLGFLINDYLPRILEQAKAKGL